MVGRHADRVGFLAEPMKSPFRGNKGKSTSGLVMASAACRS